MREEDVLPIVKENNRAGLVSSLEREKHVNLPWTIISVQLKAINGMKEATIMPFFVMPAVLAPNVGLPSHPESALNEVLYWRKESMIDLRVIRKELTKQKRRK